MATLEIVRNHPLKGEAALGLIRPGSLLTLHVLDDTKTVVRQKQFVVVSAPEGHEAEFRTLTPEAAATYSIDQIKSGELKEKGQKKLPVYMGILPWGKVWVKYLTCTFEGYIE